MIEVISEEFNEKVKSVQFDLSGGRFAVLMSISQKKQDKDADQKLTNQMIAKFY